MQKIIPFLWFEKEAREAVDFYTSIFVHSKIGLVEQFDSLDPSDLSKSLDPVVIIEFELEGLQFNAMIAGPYYQFTPAISFSVNCDSVKEIDRLWSALIDGGKALMELDKYPFSERYGWLVDKFGVSWQLNIGDRKQKIATSFLFTGDQFGKVEEAINLYTSLFDNSSISTISRYEAGEGDKEGAIKYSLFKLDGQEFIAMESSLDHKFGFTGATSMLVNCKSQEEVDKYWNALLEGGTPEACGWLRDKFGVSWQIVPTVLNDLLRDPDPVKSKRVLEAMMGMVKLDIKELKRAHEQHA